MKIKHIVQSACGIAFVIAVLALPVMAKDAPAPSEHGGEGILVGDHCFNTNSQTVTEVCVDYKISWKLWLLASEPVGDYALKWKLRTLSIKGPVGIKTYFFSGANPFVKTLGLPEMPQVLDIEAKKIELYIDGITDVYLGKGTTLGERVGFIHHAINTGVATRAGQLSYSTPGSPKWSELFLNTNSFTVGKYLSEKEAKRIFAQSHQPDLPIQLRDLQIGPKSSVSGLDALEGRIAKLCENPKTAPTYDFCPEIKKKEKGKPKKEKASKDDTEVDPFAELDKGKDGKTGSSDSSIDNAFSELEKGKSKKTKAGQGIDAGFEDVVEYKAEQERLRIVALRQQALHDEATRFCQAAFETKKSCIQNVGCGGKPSETVCTDQRMSNCAIKPGYLYICPYTCYATAPNPKYAEWNSCSISATESCSSHATESGMNECVREREYEKIGK